VTEADRAGAAARHADVVVVGAGIAGLTTAWDLTRAGLRTVVCDARSRAGGLIHTEHDGAYIIEAGPDSMLVQKPAAIELCRELGLSDDLVATLEPRTAFVLRDGVLHPIPSETVLGLPVSTSAIEACGMLSTEGRAALVRDIETPITTRSADADESVGAFVRRRFGDEAVRFIAQPLLGGIHAGDADRLSIRSLFPQLVDAEARGGSLLAALAARRVTTHVDGGAFRGLQRGMGALVERLVASLPADALALDTSVTRVGHGPPFTIETSAGTLRARAIVFATPAWVTARLLESLAPDAAEACRAIPYASSATITLAWPRRDVRHPLVGTGFVAPRGEAATRLLAASWITSKWPARAPDDVVLMRAFAGGVLDADLLALDDEALVELARRDLSALFAISGAPIRARVFRWMDAGAQYEIGHADRVAIVDAACEQHPGLFVTGSAFRGVGIPDCVADARRVAARVVRLLGVS
jgi:protoporphyrinogen/coproporphyrinogen III oxidase